MTRTTGASMPAVPVIQNKKIERGKTSLTILSQHAVGS